MTSVIQGIIGQGCHRFWKRRGQAQRCPERFSMKLSNPFYSLSHRKWIMAPCLLRALGWFHNRVSHRLTWKHLWRHLDVIWVYQLIGEAIGEAGLIIIEEYINRRKNTVAQYIVNRLIHKTWTGADGMTLSTVLMHWWYQVGIDVGGSQEMV